MNIELLNQITKDHLKKDLPEIRPGDKVRIFYLVSEKYGKEKKTKTQIIEGIVLAKKHGKGINSTITVRNEVAGVGVEWILPLHSPRIEKIEILQRHKVRRAKLYFLRYLSPKELRRKLKPVK